MWSSYKDGFGRYPIHVDADATLDIIKMNVAILRYQVGNSMFLANLVELRKEI